MILCYLLTGLTGLVCFGLLLLSLLNFTDVSLLSWLMVGCLLYFATQTLIIFFFVGTGVSMKEFIQENHIDSQHYQGVMAIKYSLFPLLMGNMGLMSLFFITLGGTILKGWPLAAALSIGVIALVQFIQLGLREHRAFQKNMTTIQAIARDYEQSIQTAHPGTHHV